NGHTLGHVLPDAVFVVPEAIGKDGDRFDVLLPTGRSDDEVGPGRYRDAIYCAELHLWLNVIGAPANAQEPSGLAVDGVLAHGHRQGLRPSASQRLDKQGLQLTLDHRVDRYA